MATLINEISIASNEQATGVSQINQGIMQVSQVVQANSSTSEESAAASEELSSQASFLKDMVNQFKLKQTDKTMSYYNQEKTVTDFTKSITGSLNNPIYPVLPKEKKINLTENDFGKYL